MTKEQYDILKKYEGNLILAHKSKQITALTSQDVLQLAAVFEQLGFSISCRTCGHSVLSMCAKLGELMLKYEKEQTKIVQEPVQVEVTEQPIEQPIEELKQTKEHKNKSNNKNGKKKH